MAATFSSTFIDINYIKDMTPMGANLDPVQVAPFILESQDIYIQDILGGAFYDHLCYVIYTAGTFSSDENVVVELASKSLAYWTVYEALPHITIKIRNIGLAQTQGDNVQVSSMEQLRYIRNEIKDKAEFWAKRLVDYLQVYRHLYPLYSNPGKLVYPANATYDSDIYIDNFGGGNLTQQEINFLKQYYYGPQGL